MAITTVVNAAYDTSGNGGRKLVRLSNGWLVAVVHDSTNAYLRFYKSIDNGQTWTEIATHALGTTYTSHAITSKNTTVYFVQGASGQVMFGKFDAATFGGGGIPGVASIDTSQSATGGVSLTINNAGTELHAAWSSKNAAYPSSFNIRYAKGTIDGNGNVSWGSVEQVTSINLSGTDVKNPAIGISNGGIPFVVVESGGTFINGSNNNTDDSITFLKRDTSLGNSGVVSDSWSFSTVYVGAAYAQSNPCAVVDGNGVIHVVWHGKDSTYTASHNIRYSKSADGGATWSTPRLLTNSFGANTGSVDQLNPSISRDLANNLYVFWHGPINTSDLTNQIRSAKFNGTAWEPVINRTTSSGGASHVNAMEKETNSMIGWIYKDTSTVKFDSITLNTPPTLTLTNPADNQTLTEGSAYTIAGTASDPDVGDAVTVRYAINGGTARNITSAISDGTTPIPFSKVLTFQNGRLYDGATDVSGPLAENTTYTVSVHAADDKGGTSASYTRSFSVVLNRPPNIVLDPYNANQTGLSELETLIFTGTVTDPEGDNVNLTASFNGGGPVTLKSGVPSGTTFEYKVPVSALANGSNTVVFTATDTKGAEKKKTLTFAKSGAQVPVNTAVTRYAITPPLGSTAEIVAWVHREIGDLNVDAAFSIVGSDANETYAAMTKTASVPVGDGGVTEDEFVGTAAQPGAKVTLRLTLTRTDANADKAVKKIMGGIG